LHEYSTFTKYTTLLYLVSLHDMFHRNQRQNVEDVDEVGEILVLGEEGQYLKLANLFAYGFYRTHTNIVFIFLNFI
jgi:hypothetical protein